MPATLDFFDSCDHYATADIPAKYDIVGGSPSVSAAGGRNGTNGLSFPSTGGSNSYVGKSLTLNRATIAVHAACKFSASTNTQNFMWVADGSAALVQVSLQRNADGSISAYRSHLQFDGGAVLLGTSAPGVASSTAVFYFIELKTTIHPSTGTVEVRVNNVTVLNLTGQNTRKSSNNWASQFAVGAAYTTGISVVADDISCGDDFIGDTHWECLFPVADGAVIQLTPSSGANHNAVDEATPNTTDTVSGTVAGNRDRYTFGPLAATAGGIVAVGVTTYNKKDDAGARTNCGVVHDGTAEGSSPAWSPGTSYAFNQGIFQTKPSGGAWTIALVNTIEAGPKIAT